MHTLEIEDYKCFRGLNSINLNQLTILAGMNSAGKSSVIQAIRLLHKAFESGTGMIEYNEELPDTYYGTAQDLVNVASGSDSFSITLYDDENDGQMGASFFSSEDGDHPLGIECVLNTEEEVLPILNKEHYYLSAERVGPRTSSPMADLSYLHSGSHGEHTAQVLSVKGGLTKVNEDRMFPESKSDKLITQTELWTDFIFPDTQLSVTSAPDSFRCQIRVRRAGTSQSLLTNVGFGVSYLLPIIVDCLVAKRDKLVIIENPEAHLHPSAQTKVGWMVAYMAKAGLKILLETHSEHIIEGIKLFAAENPEFKNKVSINFFTEGENQEAPSIRHITFEEDFSFSDYPKGFLDESAESFLKVRSILKERKNGGD